MNRDPRPADRIAQLHSQPVVDAKALRRRYFSHAYHVGEPGFVRGHGLDTINFDEGRLYLDDVPVLKARFGHDTVTWSQRTKSHYTSGHLFFARGGTELHGVVCLGPDAVSAVRHDVLATSIPTVNYATQVTKSRLAADTDPATLPDGDWEKGLVLGISYVQEIGDSLPVPKVLLDGQDISDYTAWSIDPETQATVLILNLDGSVICDFDSSLYLTGSVVFDTSQPAPTFGGSLTSTCADQARSDKQVFFWKGRADGALNLRPLREFAPAPLTEADLLADGADGLTVAELMGIVPDESVSQAANDMLVENMKWAIAQSDQEKDWLAELFGELPPVLPAERQELIKKSLSWYQEDFGKSYLGWSVANYKGANAPATNLDDSEKLKLKYFLQTGLSKSKDFNIQQNGIFINAFVEAKPRLQAYVQDNSGNWAQQLYDVVTSPGQLTLMINRIFGAAGQKGAMTPANNFATLLSALQPSGDLARKYIRLVLTGGLSNTVHSSNGGSKEEIMEWLPEFLQQFLDKVATDQSVPDSAKLAAEQIKQMLEAMGGNMTTLASELSDFVVNANGANILSKTQNAQSAFLKKWPKFEKVGNMMFFAAWCMGLIMVIKAFQNWKDLPREKKVETVIAAVNLGFQAIELVPNFLKGVKEMGLDGWKRFTEWRNRRNTQEDVEEINENINEDWARAGADETSQLFNAETKTIEAEGSLWETIFGVASKVIAVVGMLASAAFAVFSTIDFINDIKSGQPITKEVFDGIMMVTNILMTVALVLDLVVSNTVFAIAAAVLAIVGLILEIVAAFVVKPANPLDTFMSQTVIPFVKNLPPQTPPPGVAAQS